MIKTSWGRAGPGSAAVGAKIYLSENYVIRFGSGYHLKSGKLVNKIDHKIDHSCSLELLFKWLNLLLILCRLMNYKTNCILVLR